MGMNTHKDPESQQYSDHGGATITDEWKWYANDGQNTTHHAHIDEHISEKGQADRPGD